MSASITRWNQQYKIAAFWSNYHHFCVFLTSIHNFASDIKATR